MCINACAYFLFVCLLVLQAKCAEVLKLRHPYGNLVRPIVLHGRTKRELSTTRNEKGIHHQELLVTLNIEGEQYTLELRLNRDLLPEGHTISYQEGGRTVLQRPKKEDIDFCQYSGQVQGKPNSWVALSTCHGLSGALFDGTKTRYVQPADGRDIHSLHYIYEKNDMKMMHKCGTDDHRVPKGTHQLMTAGNNTRGTRHKRSFPVMAPYKSNERSRYVELVLVADHAQYVAANRNLKILHHQLQQTVNVVNALYSPLNIFIALTGVEVWTEGDRISLVKNSSISLHNFMEYRQKILFKNIGQHDHAHLITATVFYDGVVGKAFVSNMCSYQLSGAIIHQSSDVDADTIAVTANTMAHEMGHNFGMGHDPHDCPCRDNHCIMFNSVSRPLPTHWSECSMKALAVSFSKGLDHCLRNKPTSLFGAPSCGNGFVDPGEQCDCGVAMTNESRACHTCCHPETCTLRSGAKCAMGPCCNLQTCQLKSAGTVCRAAERECDLPEYCSGKSEFCPDDVFKMDTTRCSDKAYCIRGWCRSHDSQCQLLWGSTGRSGPQECYNQNRVGDDIDNCGYDVLHKSVRQCLQKEVNCGRLQCAHYNSHLEFGQGSIRSNLISVKGELKICQSTRLDLGLTEDPGMVPDGASCGDGRMCFNQRCLSVESVLKQVVLRRSEGCLANCSGYGVCNSKGVCHCDRGFAPPLCNAPGVGGSQVSGPAVDTTAQEDFKLIMFIIFLGIVPLIVLILLLKYCIMKKSTFCCKINDTQLTSNTMTPVKKAVVDRFIKRNMKDKNPNCIKKTNEDDNKVITNGKVVEIIPRSESNININVYVNGEIVREETTKVKLNNEDTTGKAIPIRDSIESAFYSKPIKIKSKVQPKEEMTSVDMEPRHHMPSNKVKSNKFAKTRLKFNDTISSKNLNVDLQPNHNNIIGKPVLKKDVTDGNLKSNVYGKNASMTENSMKSSITETQMNKSNELPERGTVKNMKNYFERNNI